LAKNCARKYPCVKCPEIHEPGQCKVTKSDETLPYCHNCKELGHPASYRGCPKYRDYKTNHKPVTPTKTKQNNIPQKQNTISQKQNAFPQKQNVSQLNNTALARPSMSYASVTKGNNSKNNTENRKYQNNPPNNLGLFSQFKDLSKKLFNTEFDSLVKRVKNFLDTYQSLNLEEQRSRYLNLVDDLILNGF
jgi:hypothetical protein